MNRNQILNSYRNNTVHTASPAKLLLMLFDGALRFVSAAENAFGDSDERGKIESVNKNLTRAQAIVRELQSSLNPEIEGEFVPTMDKLYSFLYAKLQQANLEKNPSYLNEIKDILGNLRDAWAESIQNNGIETAQAI